MKNQAIVAVFAVPLLLACAVALGAEGEGPGKGLTYAQVLEELGSADVTVRQAAQDELLSLGPEKVEEIRRIAGFLQEVVTMHGKLVAKPTPQMKERDVRTDARETIQYFSSRGAVRYLGLGLGSQLLFVRVETAKALAGLDRRIKEKQAKAFVSVVASYLEREDAVYGDEIVLVQQMAVGNLCSAMSEVAGMVVEEADKDVVNAEARAALQKVLEEFREYTPAGRAAKKALDALQNAGAAAQVAPSTDARPEPAAGPQAKPDQPAPVAE